MSRAGPALVVALAAIALWLGTSVTPGEVLAYAGYQLAFVAGPGWLLYAMLEPRPRSLLRWAALGWALGYALELAAFMITAALGARSLIWLYPVLVAGAAAVVLRRRGEGLRDLWPTQRDAESGGLWNWAAAIGLCVVFVYFAVGFISLAPLPWRVPSVLYYTDLPFHMSLAAEAKHHWPITNPGVSGLEQPYQNYVYMHVANTSHITGASISLVMMRLFFIPALMAITLALVLGGRLLTRRMWGGPLLLALVLIVGELDPDPSKDAPFGGSFFADLYLSPTFLYGMIFIVPVLVLLVEAWRDERGMTRARLVMLVLLLAACGGAKGTILPVLGAGLAGVIAWVLLTRRRIERTAAVALGALAVIFVITYETLYGGRGSGGSIEAMHALLRMPVLSSVKPHFGHHFLGKAAFWAIFLPVGLIGVLGPAWAGLPMSLRERGWRDPARVFLLGAALAGVAVLLFLEVPGESQLYFVWYGVVAGAFLSAWGLAFALQRRGWFTRTYRVLACGLLLVGALDVPFDVFPSVVKRWRAHEHLYNADGYNNRIGMTRGMYEGFRWIRDHTSPNAVIAINEHYGDLGYTDPRWFYASAFAERRVFLESWNYNIKAYDAGYNKVASLEVNPFPERFRLNSAAFDADPGALRTMRERYGVRYLYVDRVHGGAKDLRPLGYRRVFENHDALVYAL